MKETLLPHDSGAAPLIDTVYDTYYGLQPYTLNEIRNAIRNLAEYYGLQIIEPSPVSQGDSDLLSAVSSKPDRPGKLTNFLRHCRILNRERHL